MNTPSLDKYEKSVVPGGKIFVDSTLISRKVERDDVDVYYVPATQMAKEMELGNLANMILLGTVIRETACIKEETLEEALKHVIPARKMNLMGVNLKAVQAGKDYRP